MPHIQADC